MNYTIGLKRVKINKLSLAGFDIDLFLNFENKSDLKFTIEKQKYAVYVNGVLERTTDATGRSNLRTSTNNWVMGSITTTNFTSGYTAIAQIYNRALSATEIKQNYNATKGRYGL
jgi:hypothetical protein